eukprot:GHRQ01022834.1.p2 GENE.GHRQ01022834.1~~GHRQ01022834.1.p2  ORF type:complete len:105 (+),score=21.22 GHRQ01022834.1:942-1256(+)
MAACLLTIVREEQQRQEREQQVPKELGGGQFKAHQQVGDAAVQQRLQGNVRQLNQHLQQHKGHSTVTHGNHPLPVLAGNLIAGYGVKVAQQTALQCKLHEAHVA